MYNGCIYTVFLTFQEFDSIGLVIHTEKSEFIPKQQMNLDKEKEHNIMRYHTLLSRLYTRFYIYENHTAN